jgi:hypothetical protein
MDVGAAANADAADDGSGACFGGTFFGFELSGRKSSSESLISANPWQGYSFARLAF